jgi:hypothetical protein
MIAVLFLDRKVPAAVSFAPFLGFCWKWLHVELSEALHICFPFYTQPQVYVKTTTTNLRRYGKVANEGLASRN